MAQDTPFGEEDATGGHDPAEAVRMRQQLVDWAKGKVASWGTPRNESAGPGSSASFNPGSASASRAPLELRRLDRPWFPAHATANEPIEPTELEPCGRHDSEVFAAEEGDFTPSQSDSSGYQRPPTALQIHNRYLVTETQEGVTIIDQHALHERILYEHLRERVSAGAMEMQSLLVPEPVDLSSDEAAMALENRDLLAELGMKVEPFGGDTVLIAGYPAMLANISPVEILRALLEHLMSDVKQPDRRIMLDELLHTIACKAAIKAGDRLAPEEIASLLEQRHLIADAHHCPHGRPTALVFTREELDKQFKRI
jgi:DNA mismatch repair protein MutL